MTPKPPTEPYFTLQCLECEQTATLTLRELRRLGLPFCPEHQAPMSPLPQHEPLEVAEALELTMRGLTHLVAAALRGPSLGK